MTSAGLSLLIADDDEVMRKLLGEVFEKQGYQVTLAESGEQALRLLSERNFALVLSDIRMLSMTDGMVVLKTAKSLAAGSIVVLMTGFGSMSGAMEALQLGAFDYVSKPFRIDEIKAVIARASQQYHAIIQNRGSVLANAGVDVKIRALVGKSSKTVEVYKVIARAALSQSHVLITGEKGTGKTQAARAIHENSQRREAPFEVLDCEFENDEEGRARYHEALDRVNTGTLVLASIHLLSAGLQRKIFESLTHLKCRIIATALSDLRTDEGGFHQNLLYSLRAIELKLPPLREHLEDLPELIGVFLPLYSSKNSKAVSHISDEAMRVLRQYSWPGNVRELEHAIERAVVMTRSAVLFPEDFPHEVWKPEASQLALVGHQNTGGTLENSPSLERIERAHILSVLQEVGFNKSKAAEVLGIDRATLYRKAQKYQIDLKLK